MNNRPHGYHGLIYNSIAFPIGYAQCKVHTDLKYYLLILIEYDIKKYSGELYISSKMKIINLKKHNIFLFYMFHYCIKLVCTYINFGPLCKLNKNTVNSFY